MKAFSYTNSLPYLKNVHSPQTYRQIILTTLATISFIQITKLEAVFESWPLQKA